MTAHLRYLSNLGLRYLSNLGDYPGGFRRPFRTAGANKDALIRVYAISSLKLNRADSKFSGARFLSISNAQRGTWTDRPSATDLTRVRLVVSQKFGTWTVIKGCQTPFEPRYLLSDTSLVTATITLYSKPFSRLQY